MSDFGITRFGAYVPRLRIERSAIAGAHAWMAPGLKGRAKGARAFASWDEDAVTMAVEACLDCLGSAEARYIAELRFASLNFPYADLSHGALVASALQLGPGVRTIDHGHSQRAGTAALIDGLTSERPTLVVGADNPQAKPASTQELLYGAGAAAFFLGEDRVLARLVATHSATMPFVDHFRPTGAKFDYFWEERWVRDEGYAKIVPDAVKAVLEKAQLDLSAIDHLVIPSLQSGAAQFLARKLGFGGQVADGLEDGVGYAGSAHPLLMLAATLEKARPGERILVVGFGQGADAIILQATDVLADAHPLRGVSGNIADRIDTREYLRMLSFAGNIEPDWGMRSEKVVKTALTEQYRSQDQIDGIVAGKCKSCGTVQFPQLSYCVACNAPAEQFEQESLLGVPAEVLTFTADWLSYYQAPPMYVGFMQFANGARLLTEVVDVGPSGIDVGTPLRLTYRIKDRDTARGYNRYFWKATPLASAPDKD